MHCIYIQCTDLLAFTRWRRTQRCRNRLRQLEATTVASLEALAVGGPVTQVGQIQVESKARVSGAHTYRTGGLRCLAEPKPWGYCQAAQSYSPATAASTNCSLRRSPAHPQRFTTNLLECSGPDGARINSNRTHSTNPPPTFDQNTCPPQWE